jgi:hypothetical protein
MQLSLFGGTFLRIGSAANDVDDEHRPAPKSAWVAEVEGFNVTEPAIITGILTHLGLDPEPPTLARARDPTDDVA